MDELQQGAHVVLAPGPASGEHPCDRGTGHWVWSFAVTPQTPSNALRPDGGSWACSGTCSTDAAMGPFGVAARAAADTQAAAAAACSAGSGVPLGLVNSTATCSHGGRRRRGKGLDSQGATRNLCVRCARTAIAPFTSHAFCPTLPPHNERTQRHTRGPGLMLS